MEDNDLDYTLWNYVYDNTHKHGDLWNGENLSIRAENGNRALQALIRPYAYQIGSACRIRTQKFNSFTQRYHLTIVVEKGSDFQKVCVFMPRYHYKIAPNVAVSYGKLSFYL